MLRKLLLIIIPQTVSDAWETSFYPLSHKMTVAGEICYIQFDTSTDCMYNLLSSLVMFWRKRGRVNLTEF